MPKARKTAGSPTSLPDDETVKSESPAALVESPHPPPSPTVETRPSWRLMIAGNALAILLSLAIARDWAPNWVLCIVLVSATFAMAIWSERLNEALLSQFRGFRRAELAPYYPDEIKLEERLEKDADASVDIIPSIAGISIPALFLTLMPLYFIFKETNTYLGNILPFFRLTLAGAAAAIVWLVFVLLWFVTNFTAANTRIDYAALQNQIPITPELEIEDQNDIHIIREISNLASIHRKIETYTLESALLSALSFSSFLTIALSERNYDAQLRTLFPPPMESYGLPGAIDLPLIGRLDHLWLPSTTYLSSHIVGLIAVSLLMCASTFLGVLVARLRFNDGYRDAESALKAAERLNDRENAAYERSDAAKVEIYSKAIDSMLQKAEALQQGLTLTVMQMRISRNTGIFFFVVTLVLCGLFFNTGIATLIAFMFVLATLCGSIDRFARTSLQRRTFDKGLAALLIPFKKGARR